MGHLASDTGGPSLYTMCALKTLIAMRTSTIAHCTSAWDHQRPPTNVQGKSFCTRSLSLSCNSFSLFLFSSFFTDRGLVRLLPLLSQEFLAHSRLFVRPSFDLLTGRTILFYFFSPLLGEDGLIFEGTIAERVTFLFSLFFLLFRHLFVQSKIGIRSKGILR